MCILLGSTTITTTSSQINLRSWISICLTVLLGFSLLTGSAMAGFEPTDYGRTFRGDCTYYGWTDGGNCAMRSLPTVYVNMQAIAINAEQYAGSKSCGACVQYTGQGGGAGANPIIGTHIAYVHDQCPECHHGSIDLSKSGDGRFPIKFKFVPCPFEDDLTFLFEGSHTYYWKIQARGLKYPVAKIVANGIVGQRTQDNFFVMQNGNGHGSGGKATVVDIMGRVFVAVIDRMVNDVDIRPSSVQMPASDVRRRPSRTPPNSPKRPPRNPRWRGPPRRSCVPNGKFCGPKNWFRTSKCCGTNYACAPVRNQPTFRCMPITCIAKYQPCTDSKGRNKGTRCCQGTRCRRHPSLRYSICL